MKKFVIVAMIVAGFVTLVVPKMKALNMESRAFASQDLAGTWRKLVFEKENRTFAFFANVLSLAVDSENSNIIYLGTRGQGIFKSSDHGESWRELNDSAGLLDKADVYDIAIDPKVSNSIYASVYSNNYGRIFKSQDQGETWQEVYVTSEPKYGIFTLAIDKTKPNVVYAGTAQGGLLKSVDFGESWEIVRWFDSFVSDIALNPKDPKEIYASVSKKGILKTRDGGKTWNELIDFGELNSADIKIEKILIDEQKPQIVYIAGEQGIFSSVNGGQSFGLMKTISPVGAVSSLVLCPGNSDCLYYGSGSLLYQSFDRGKSWRVHEIAGVKNITVIAIDPQNHDNIYVGGEN